MLPPPTGSGLSTARRHSFTTISSIPHPLRATAAHSQARGFWSWRTARGDYSSHLDPVYQRFTRYRTMKTRAKLLEKLKRRGKFEWDLNQRPFFTPKHIRFASHFNSGRDGGGGGPRWPPYNPENDHEQDSTRKQSNAKALEDSNYELSQREKEWKERMEYMRKRIENDPYEAVFGKRFEPFWSPLVPSWMREEMGLRGWPSKAKEREEEVEKEVVRAAAAGRAETIGNMEKGFDKASKTNGQGSKPVQKQQDSTTKPKLVDVTVKTNAPQSTSYSSYSSTSWDSWTNKTKRTEWDSTSGQVKRFEYDPVSNRMIPIPPPQAEVKAVEPAKTVAVKTESTIPAALQLRRADDMRSLINTPPARSEGMAVQIPVRKSYAVASKTVLSVPTVRTDEDVLKEAQWSFRSTPAHGKEAAVGNPAPPPPIRQTETLTKASAARPAALAKLPANDLDLLTADDVRAKMGKVRGPSHAVRPTTAAEKAAMDERFESSAAEWDKAEDAVIRERERERGRMGELKASSAASRQGDLQRSASPAAHPGALKVSSAASIRGDTARLQTSLHRKANMAPNPAEADVTGLAGLQSALERMMSKDLPSTTTDLDDAAAHESTESIELPPSVPKEWSQAADILQASRVQRVASKKPFPPPLPRWIDDMEARKAAHEAAQPLPSPAEQARTEKLEKTNAMLEAEIREQKVRMQAHEGRYAHKLRSLRQELDVAYRQSAVHAEKHVERIRFLEGEVERKGSKAVVGREKEGGEKAGASKGAETGVVQGEGDFSPDIAKFAGSERWYKMPASQPPVSEDEIEKAEQKARDQKLVKEVREVYEREYGVIDAQHRQPQKQQSPKISARSGYLSELASDSGAKRQAQTQTQKQTQSSRKQVVEVESDVDLGEALAEHEKHSSYGFRDDGLEKEIQAKEREAHEAQALLIQPESAEKMERVVAESLKPTPPPQAKGIPAAHKPTESPTTQWEHPPVYRILAYDSGNDKFSTASTTANFTGTETPISIPHALSQLYQPARFVPHFAALQQEGWQVIHGTADLLVFRKVAKVIVEPVTRGNEAADGVESSAVKAAALEDADAVSLADHGVVTPKENALAQEAANFYDRYKPAPKEYDPTSIENGKLMPYENSMAQEAAHAYDAAIARSAAVNPIDGTTKTVFSGTKRASSKSQRKWNERHERHQRRQEEAKREGRRRGRRGGAVKWALGVGVGAAGVAYAVGVAAEMARQERRERERWRGVF
ncbi:hypothetical protein B0A55_10560 [Friedmanniomyces simplex]|uniref:Uncharacterized protein n=1 Tax=Friedmanniomyces simplex TaxID=329884 RepID=A0A4V5NE31_9PEZI|nr:hypothetical protein B0A55_10560 [Friedmanniomyces simplex]